MYFEIIDFFGINRTHEDGFYLVEDNWNDFGYYTTYHLWIIENNEKKEIGVLNLAHKNYNETDSPNKYINIDELNKDNQAIYISLGTAEYYKNLIKLGKDKREKILTHLQDLAFNLNLYNEYNELLVVQTSFLRGIKTLEVKKKLNRLARGKLQFKYNIDISKKDNENYKLSLNIDSLSNLPTNIHALIGSNGSGKTETLQGIASACQAQVRNKEFINKTTTSKDGNFQATVNYFSETNYEDEFPIENIIYISYSPFDNHANINDKNNIKFVGILNSKLTSSNFLSNIMEKELARLLSQPDETENLSTSILDSYEKVELWNQTISSLTFDKQIRDLSDDLTIIKQEPISNSIIKKLSSGQKILLLSLANIINQAVERTLIIIDEPELFLHPPLVTAYIRELSNILLSTNSLCLIATHSPFVVQEIPNNCVHILIRNMDKSYIENPDSQTFGENIATINNTIFGTDMRATGFYKLMSSLAENDSNKSKDLLLSNRLGTDAEIILRSHLMKKEDDYWNI